jgi:hypothetical protein
LRRYGKNKKPVLSIINGGRQETEAERELVEANKKLIEIYEQKIQAKLEEIWGSKEG